MVMMRGTVLGGVLKRSQGGTHGILSSSSSLGVMNGSGATLGVGSGTQARVDLVIGGSSQDMEASGSLPERLLRDRSSGMWSLTADSRLRT